MNTPETDGPDASLLQRHLELFRAIFERAAVGMAQIDTATGRFIRVNRRYAEIMGYSREELEGLELRALVYPEDQPAEAAALRRLMTGEVRDFTTERRYQRRDGSAVRVNVTISVLWGQSEPPSSHLAVVEDISRRNRAESALRRQAEELEERAALAQFTATVLEILAGEGELNSLLQRCAQSLVDVFDGAFARIWTLNAEEEVLELQASAGLYTRLDGAHARVPVGELKIGLIAQERKPHLTNQVIGDPRVTQQEWARREGMAAFAGYPLLADDRVVGVMAMFARHPLSEQHLQAMAAVSHAMAVTIERKRAERELQRLNRALRTLSECNQAIVRATDEGRLLREVCDLVVQLGGYRMAWVGLAQNDDARSVKPAAQAGVDEGFLDSAEFSWADGEDGRGPTGMSIRERRPVTTRHIGTDPDFAIWRDAAVSRGYLSAIALPLVADGTDCLGALNIYAAEVDAFDAAEVKLLSELAGDITFGLRALRDRAARDEAEGLLRSAAERLGLALQAANQGIYDLDVQSGEAQVSAEYATMLGYDPAEFRESNAAWLDRMHPDDREPVAAVYRDYIAGRIPEYRIEFRQRTRSGDWKWILSLGRIVERDPAGLPLRMLGTHTDITERKRAEDERRALAARQHALLAAIPDIVMEVDARKVYTWAHRPGLDFFGEDVVGREAGSYFEGEQRTYELVQPIFEGSEEVTYVESWQRRCDGEKRLLAWWCRVLKDDEGRVIGAISSARDITDHQRAEESLRASEERLRALSENLAEGMTYQIDSGADGSQRQFTYVSPAVERLHGLKAEEVMRNPALLYDQVVEEDRRRVAEEEAEAFRTRTKLDTDLRVRIPSGAIRWRRFTSSPRVGPAGNVLWDGIELDITDRKQAEAEQAQLQNQLTQAQKMESIGRLAGGVAHDFNNMLQAILGNASLALEALSPGSPAREYLEEIRTAGERSAGLTRQLLAFARKQAIAPRVVDLNETVAGVLKLLRHIIGEDIDLSWIPGANLWPVNVDTGQLDQILANLCVNARDAIAGAGKVTIETGKVTLDEGYASTLPDWTPGDYVVLAVTDNGAGMDQETRSHLFEPFFTTKDVGKGTGLGLATVFGIVRQNRGLIDVESEPGRGATFRIYLPRAEAEPASPVAEDAGHLQRGSKTVLVVEDEQQVLSLSHRILEGLGYTVLGAPSPEAALDVAARHPGSIDLLITDVIMPVMNGKELRDRLLATHPTLKCLFMSGYTADVIAHHGVLDEGVDFLQKPFGNRALAAKVEELLAR